MEIPAVSLRDIELRCIGFDSKLAVKLQSSRIWACWVHSVDIQKKCRMGGLRTLDVKGMKWFGIQIKWMKLHISVIPNPLAVQFQGWRSQYLDTVFWDKLACFHGKAFPKVQNRQEHKAQGSRHTYSLSGSIRSVSILRRRRRCGLFGSTRVGAMGHFKLLKSDVKVVYGAVENKRRVGAKKETEK